MQIFYGINSFKPTNKNIVVALGMFDGVHLGHKKVLNTAQDIAKKINGEVLVITFDTHPKQLFTPKNSDYILTTNEEKIHIFKKLNIPNVLFLYFDLQTANMTALNFLQKDLLKTINPHTIVVGENFKFGKDKKGDVDLIRKFCNVESIQELKNGNTKISSTNIRKALKNGDLSTANKLLGHEYFILNQVIHGLGLASKFEVPTANIHIPKYKLLPEGVFKGLTTINEIDYLSAVSIRERKCESHLINFSKDIYHETVCVKLIEKVRDQRKFDSLAAIFVQVKLDIKKILGT